MQITVIDHPLVRHKLSLMRESETSTYKFRTLAKELARLMAYEASRDFPMEKINITGWEGNQIEGEQVKGKTVTVVPILRAGLGMLDGVLDLIPTAKISMVGLQRDNAFAQIDVQLKRRHDLIPNLITTVKGYLVHEENTLTKVIAARNHAMAVQHLGNNLDSNPQMQQLAQAEGRLTRALGQFYATVESYPELKADSMVQELLDELTNTENRIGFARQHYNDSVMSYNSDREVFPNNLISSTFTFPPMSLLQFENKAQIDQTPLVDMSR